MSVAIDTESHEEIKRQLAQAEADGERMTDEIARLRAALRGERERCAKLASEYYVTVPGGDSPHYRIRTVGECIARSIRATDEQSATKER